MDASVISGYVAVIPAYNEAATIRDIAVRTLGQVPRLIVVDDGSDDATAAALEGLPVTVLRNAVNMGKAASLWRGMQRALELRCRSGDHTRRRRPAPARGRRRAGGGAPRAR